MGTNVYSDLLPFSELEVDELVFGNDAQKVIRQQDQREQYEEYGRVPCRDFQIIMLFDEQEND